MSDDSSALRQPDRDVRDAVQVDTLRWRVVGPVAMLSLPGLGFLVPFFGPWLSMFAVGVAVPGAGRRVWHVDRTRRLPMRTLGIAALWLPGLLAISLLILLGERLGSPETGPGLEALAGLLEAVGMTYWLFLPLAGPEDPWTPAAVALALLVTGSIASACVRRPWPWLLGAAAAPLAYAATVHALDIAFVA